MTCSKVAPLILYAMHIKNLFFTVISKKNPHPRLSDWSDLMRWFISDRIRHIWHRESQQTRFVSFEVSKRNNLHDTVEEEELCRSTQAIMSFRRIGFKVTILYRIEKATNNRIILFLTYFLNTLHIMHLKRLKALNPMPFKCLNRLFL